MLWRATGKGRSPQAAMNSRLNRWICRAYSRKLQRSTGVDSDPILRIGLAPGHQVWVLSRLVTAGPFQEFSQVSSKTASKYGGTGARDQPKVLPDDGRRHHGGERAGQGLGVHGALARRRAI